MLQKRDEYNPKRRKGLSAIEKRKKQADAEWLNRIDIWDFQMNCMHEQFPYLVEGGSEGGWIICRRSKFPQRYPEYDRVVEQVFEEWKKRQTIRHYRAIKEELMMTCWHPDRLEKMLEQGYEFD
jgi:hypothetical protein